MISACTAIYCPPLLCKGRPLPLCLFLSIYPSPPFIHSFIYLISFSLPLFISMHPYLSLPPLPTYPDLIVAVCLSVHPSVYHIFVLFTYFTRPPSMFSSNNSNLLIPPKFQVNYAIQVALFSSYFAQPCQKSLSQQLAQHILL